jgi:hypothetical protein
LIFLLAVLSRKGLENTGRMSEEEMEVEKERKQLFKGWR